MAENRWFKKNETDKTWWLDNGDSVRGVMIFSFDKKKQYNLFQDYPHNMNPDEVKMFDKENPFWADFFKDRKEG